MSGRDTQGSIFAQYASRTTRMTIFIVTMATVNGLFVAWLTLPFDHTAFNLDVTVWAFLLVWAVGVGYFFYKRTPSDIAGLSLYVLAGVIVLKPPLLFGTVLDAASDSGSGLARPAVATTLGDLFIWQLVAIVVAIVFLLVGRFFRARAERTTLRRMRRELRTQYRE